MPRDLLKEKSTKYSRVQLFIRSLVHHFLDRVRYPEQKRDYKHIQILIKNGVLLSL